MEPLGGCNEHMKQTNDDDKQRGGKKEVEYDKWLRLDGNRLAEGGRQSIDSGFEQRY